MNRASGILLPIFSLPSPYGIGCFDRAAYNFVDALHQAKQSYWQILPLGLTGHGNSPYQSYSAFAGNPFFIDLTKLTEQGLLTGEECDAYPWSAPGEPIDYDLQAKAKPALLRKAFARDQITRNTPAYLAFLKEHEDWLSDYALYMACKDAFGDKVWQDWDEPLRTRTPAALEDFRQTHAENIAYYQYEQYLFFTQWQDLKAYANQKGIAIIGDMPIYVASDSVDVWCHTDLFQLNEKGYPTRVSGCPPDAFSETGQLWGNPLYDWEVLKQRNYDWWFNRVRRMCQLYDWVRIDHFRAFESYYAIPAGDQTAEFGTWEPGPDYDFFAKLKKEQGKLSILAEDLGYLTPGVHRLLRRSGCPGMKVLQFAFAPGQDSDYLPHHYSNHCIVYTGTHDNDTLAGWLASLSRKERAFVRQYLGLKRRKPVCEDLIRLAHASVADLCIVPLQDYLELGSEARINTPSTVGANWQWRSVIPTTNDPLWKQIGDLTVLYSRAGSAKKH